MIPMIGLLPVETPPLSFIPSLQQPVRMASGLRRVSLCFEAGPPHFFGNTQVESSVKGVGQF